MVHQLHSQEPVGPAWDIGQVDGSHSRGYEAREQGQQGLVLCATEKTLLWRIGQQIQGLWVSQVASFLLQLHRKNLGATALPERTGQT